VIEKMGDVPVFRIHPTEVRSTRENLQVAVDGEKYERDIMCPEFIEVARRQNATAAVRTFAFALKVEAVHAALYQDALDNMETRKGERHTYYVCPDCGNILHERTILSCLVCGQLKSGFIAVD
jgi:rubrerythrin